MINNFFGDIVKAKQIFEYDKNHELKGHAFFAQRSIFRFRNNYMACVEAVNTER